MASCHALHNNTAQLLQGSIYHPHQWSLPWSTCRHKIAENLCALLQIAMGTFVSYFFSGFILGKIPFPLSPSFRLMLQVMPRPARPL